MNEITQDMQRAGLDAFMTWREAPHGIGFGDVVISVYTAMEAARVGKELPAPVHAEPEWRRELREKTDEREAASPAISKLLDAEAAAQMARPKKPAAKKAPAKKA